MDLDSVVDELYGVAPAAFTSRREALVAEARKEGDRDRAAAIKALRRPSAAAHAVNMMARHRGEEIDRLVELGRRLRQAQEALSGEELRALGRQRQHVVAGLAEEARADSGAAGLNLSDAARREVQSTFEAALGDEAAADAVRSGRLVRSLVRTGLDPVDLEGAVAGGVGAVASLHATRPGRDRSAPAAVAPLDGKAAPRTDENEARARAESDLARAEEAAARAAAAAEQAELELGRCVTDEEAATRKRADADEEVIRLQERLAAARSEADRAADDERAHRRARGEAEDASELARREADAAAKAREQARDRLSRLRPLP